MGKRRRLRGSKYTVGFKRQLVAESLCEGASVLKVSRRHGVSTSRIYSWRSDARLRNTSPYRLTLKQAQQFIRDIK